MRDILSWAGFLFSVFIAGWTLWIILSEDLPDWVYTLLRRSFNLVLWILYGTGAGLFWVIDRVVDLLLILWRGQPQAAAPPKSVNPFPVAALPYVAPPLPVPSQNRQTDPSSVCLSADLEPKSPPAPSALAAIMIDSETTKDRRRDATSKKTLIAALIDAGWGYSEIRDAVKGDNNTLRAEFEAAHARLGGPAPQPTRPSPTIARRPATPGAAIADPAPNEL
jgi:hypothetical protein